MKKVGLSRESKKYIEIYKFPKGMPPTVFLHLQSQDFYNVFRNTFRDGHFIIEGLGPIPIMSGIGACLVNYHFAVELILKALISFKFDITEFRNRKPHNLIFLLEEAYKLYPTLSAIYNNQEYTLLLDELGQNFATIRYAEGCICLSLNKKKGWKTKLPMQEFSEILHDIYMTFSNLYDAVLRESNDVAKNMHSAP